MTQSVGFTKMHGAGNDYIYVNTMVYPLENPEELAAEWSTPHTGIGADGLVLIGSSKKADFSMRIFNADGSEAMMCGNASRCIGKYVYEAALTDKETITLETLSGIKTLQLNVTDGCVTGVTVDMGVPEVTTPTLHVEVGGQTFTGTVISMGNPHLVVFTDDVSSIDLKSVGPLLETHPLFPGRINVEFAEIKKEDEVRMRVWERGSGITLACGTGACATAVAGAVCGMTGRRTKVIMDGGPLTIHWSEDDGKVYMTGDAVKVFEGTITTK